MSGPYDHDGQHHSHAENQGQNLLQVHFLYFSGRQLKFTTKFPTTKIAHFREEFRCRGCPGEKYSGAK